MKYYVKTSKDLNQAIKDYSIKPGYDTERQELNCYCGESQGVRVYFNGSAETIIILCPECYRTATHKQRYL